jgi:hypothetical protein
VLPLTPRQSVPPLQSVAAVHVAFALSVQARPLEFRVSRPPMRSLSLRPDDSLTIPKMALSIGFIRFVSSANAILATGVLTLALVGLPPTEYASLELDTHR